MLMKMICKHFLLTFFSSDIVQSDWAECYDTVSQRHAAPHHTQINLVNRFNKRNVHLGGRIYKKCYARNVHKTLKIVGILYVIQIVRLNGWHCQLNLGSFGNVKFLLLLVDLKESVEFFIIF